MSRNSGDGTEPIGIAEAVDHLRDELLRARADGGDGLEFQVGPVELEFSVEMRREGKGKTGLKAWVVSAGAERSVSQASVHRLKFVLTPRDTRTGGAYHVADDRPDSTVGTLGSRYDR
jgi:hypothetical protein